MDRIKINNIIIEFDDKLLLAAENLTIHSNEAISLLGLNGSGKSTLLRVLAGIQNFKQNAFETCGTVLYQPQKPALLRMSVLQNTIIGMDIPDKEKAFYALKMVGLEKFINKQAKTLSGGEQQRLFLARSMLTSGDIILLDEPFSAVDIKTDIKLNDILIDYCKKNTASLIIATHSLKTAELISDKCLLIKDKKLVISDIQSAKEYLVSAI